METRRPRLDLLGEDLVERIVDQAWEVLERAGVQVEDPAHLAWIRAQGLQVDAGTHRVFFERKESEVHLRSAPPSFRVYGRDDEEGVEIGGDHTVFDPGSAALFWLDAGTNDHRRGSAADCKRLAVLTEALDGYRLQSTGIVPADAPEALADCVRLFFSLVYCRKPVITGTFRRESFGVMERMLRVVSAGSTSVKASVDRPNAIFDCCPSPPLKWSGLTLSALFDCARSGVPAELVAMPLAGATAPVTIVGSLVQFTAENLSGVILHQMTRAGAPIVWGGSPAAFDMRHGTTPMGAMETMMIDLGAAQIGRRLGLPTHAYMACSDSKSPDYQAGLETGMGAVLAAAGGIHVVSGPGFLNYENTQSPEKLVLDDEACALAQRLVRGIHPRTEVDPVELLVRHAQDGEFITDDTTADLHLDELALSGPTIDRGSVEDWAARGHPTSREVARAEVERILEGPHGRLDEDRRGRLRQLLLEEATGLGVDSGLEELLGI